MKATIIKIHPPKYSRSEGVFYRIEFQLETGAWSKTDIVTKYRNYARWRKVIRLGAGTCLAGLRMHGSGFVDADSYPQVIQGPIAITRLEEEVKKPKDAQDKLF